MISIIQDPVFLRQKSLPIENTQEAKDIMFMLEDTLNKYDGYGLSAIQIGIPKRIALIKGRDGYFPIINPKIIEVSGEEAFDGEGCLSFPNFFVKTIRHEVFIIDNNVIEGDNFRVERQYYNYTNSNAKDISDYESLAAQHEIDHFDGKIIVDYGKRIDGSTIVRQKCKVGRNDLCPCGSNKKYKKCCLSGGKYE